MFLWNILWYQSGSNSFYQYSLCLHNFLRMELSNVELFGDSSSCCGSCRITWLVGFGCSCHMSWRRNLLVGYGVGMDVLMGVVFCCCGGVEDGHKKLRNSIISPCFGCRGVPTTTNCSPEWKFFVTSVERSCQCRSK